MNGTITITRGGKVTIHTYTSPPQGWLVSTHILEGPAKLVIFDGQRRGCLVPRVAGLQQDV